MIEVLTNILISLCLLILGIMYGFYIVTVCINRYGNKNIYPKKEFKKDLTIPFRLWYITFCKLFEE